ncbi:hypothetical protein EYC84_010161 [Monilinia fructicola]|uniref:Nucleotidyltransferase n=1 Tax=Monilinia fructicola TaxID=38448 RepID=A0A5M9JCT8_MONFR|nr:hypothetical protein EYC84_010161 [Monilinia fructicola]
MGGQAFASHVPPIKTPRMTREVYDNALQQNQAILRKFYSKVASAIEGPGKSTYGDLDILVALPLEDAFSPQERVPDKLKEALHASAWMQYKGNPTINFAVPWPENSPSPATNRLGEDGEDIAKSTHVSPEEWYVQVDVYICRDEHDFDWQLFHYSHGDLCTIIRTIIKIFGLTINNHGLFIRIPEIEFADKKKSMVFLTDDPAKTLDFLGLDQEKWWKPFKTQWEMFEYAATCRMSWIRNVVEGEAERDVIGIKAEGQEGGEKEKGKLKYNDGPGARRPIFQAWLDEFIPHCHEEERYSDIKITREEIRDEAFKKFGVREEYETRRHDWNLAKHLVELVNDGIKGNIPLDGVDNQMRSAATKVLMGIIMKGEPYEGGMPEAATKDANGFYDLGLVKQFVRENWRNAGSIGMARQQIRAREAMRAKAEERAKAEKAKLEQDSGLQESV